MLESIKFSFKEKATQKGLWTPNHKLYSVTIKYNDKSMKLDYQCNPNYELPTLYYCLSSALMDTYGYDNCENIEEFAKEFGYEVDEDCKNIYKGCKLMSQKIHKMFTVEELEMLEEELTKENVFEEEKGEQND